MNIYKTIGNPFPAKGNRALFDFQEELPSQALLFH